MAFKLHEWNETDFTGGCLAYLNKAYEVAVFEGLQETHTVSFKYPMKDEKAELIKENRIVSVEGQAYRITLVKKNYSGSRIMTVKANRIFYDDALHHHLPTIGNDTDVTKSTIGVDPYDVIKLAIADTKFELISRVKVDFNAVCAYSRHTHFFKFTVGYQLKLCTGYCKFYNVVRVNT